MATLGDFVHLHVHSQYGMPDGAGHLKELTMRKKPARQFTVIVLAFICFFPLTGCIIAPQFAKSTRYLERLDPTSILVGADGTIAVQATASYCHETLWRPHSESIPELGTHQRFLVLSAEYIKSVIKSTREYRDRKTSSTLSKSRTIEITLPRIAELGKNDGIIPAGLFDPDANPDMLPPSLRSADAQHYNFDSEFSYLDGVEKIRLVNSFPRFPETQDPVRSQDQPKRYWAIPIGIVEAPVDVIVAVGVAAISITLFPVAGLAMAGSGG